MRRQAWPRSGVHSQPTKARLHTYTQRDLDAAGHSAAAIPVPLTPTSDILLDISKRVWIALFVRVSQGHDYLQARLHLPNIAHEHGAANTTPPALPWNLPRKPALCTAAFRRRIPILEQTRLELARDDGRVQKRQTLVQTNNFSDLLFTGPFLSL